MSISKASLRKLNRRLPKGAVPMALDRLSQRGIAYAPSYLYMILKGKRFNAAVIDVLIEVANEHEQEQKQRNARAQGITA